MHEFLSQLRHWAAHSKSICHLLALSHAPGFVGRAGIEIAIPWSVYFKRDEGSISISVMMVMCDASDIMEYDRNI